MEIYLFNLAVVDAIKSVTKDPFEPLFEKGVHNGTILNLSLCPQRSILLTISSDKNAKLWEYSSEEGYKELISFFFYDQPYSVSLHPTGL